MVFVSGAEAITPKYLICYTKTEPSATQPTETNGRMSTHDPLSPPTPLLPDDLNQSSTLGQSTNITMNSPANSTLFGRQPVGPDPDILTDPKRDQTVTSNSNGGPISVQAQPQARLPAQIAPPPSNGPTLFPSDPYILNFPGPPSTCRLNGCDKPVCAGPSIDRPNEYCSQSHREWVFSSLVSRSKFTDGSIGRQQLMDRSNYVAGVRSNPKGRVPISVPRAVGRGPLSSPWRSWDLAHAF